VGCGRHVWGCRILEAWLFGVGLSVGGWREFVYGYYAHYGSGGAAA
jgi:hypothetical protein